MRPRAEFLVEKYVCIKSKVHLDSCARPKKRRHQCHAHLKLRGGRAQTGRPRACWELLGLVRVNTGRTVSNCFYQELDFFMEVSIAKLPSEHILWPEVCNPDNTGRFLKPIQFCQKF